MSNEREAFETWLADPNYAYSDRDRDMMFWAWQASRKVALEEATKEFGVLFYEYMVLDPWGCIAPGDYRPKWRPFDEHKGYTQKEWAEIYLGRLSCGKPTYRVREIYGREIFLVKGYLNDRLV